MINSELIFEIYDENYPTKKLPCLLGNFEIFVIFEILAIFEFSKGYFDEMAKNIGNFFFVVFGQVDVLYILVEFEVDGMRPNESTKNGRKGAHGFYCKIFVNFETIYEIYEKLLYEKLL